MDSVTFEEKRARLDDVLRGLSRVVIGFSGGVDSTVVLKAATVVLGAENAVGVTAASESNTDEDLALCRSVADEHGFNHRVIEYSELAIPNYASNPANRCYYCKAELYDRLRAVAEELGGAVVCDGSNVDDAGDYRPGLTARDERQVRSPLREAGFTKGDVRRLAREFGLPNHDKPAAPCLSSRIPYGNAITREKLEQVAEGERCLRSLGLRQVRCRHHDDMARIEVDPEYMPILLEHREAIVARFKEIGFRYVTIDLQGFRSGSLNEVLGLGAPSRGEPGFQG